MNQMNPTDPPRLTARRMATTFLALLLALAALPCEAARIVDPIPAPIPLGSFAVRLVTLTSGIAAPNWAVPAPGVLPARIFVVDQPGYVWSVSTRDGQRFKFLNVASRLVPLGLGGPGTFDSRGLLGLAFHPQYAANGLLYTYTSEPPSGPAEFPLPPGTPVDHVNVVTEWRVANPSDPAARVQQDSARVLLRVEWPDPEHNGGCLTFGPDGFLYVSLGDGGNKDDQGSGHSEQGNGQDTMNVLGDILRIDPLGTNSGNSQYGIPATNPFVGLSGFLPEIYANGFRNPWRFSFDPANGLFYVADVGQSSVEEVDIVTAGGNYGWRWREGGFFFDPNGDEDGFVTDVDPGAPPGLIDPVAQYDHDEGRAVIGGYVYRGALMPTLDGGYVFGDYARNYNNDGRLLIYAGNGIIRELRIVGQSNLAISLMGFGHDARGELYVLGNTTSTPSGTTGVVRRILPAQPGE
jgi:glucose/arabinose dehydrogenase